jgi:hypothetical protein
MIEKNEPAISKKIFDEASLPSYNKHKSYYFYDVLWQLASKLCLYDFID